MASSILSVFSSSEKNYLKNLLKEPEKDFEEVISILDKKVQESTKQFIELDEKYKSIIDGLTQVGIGIDIVNKDYRVLFQNQVLKERFGDCRGKKCYSNYIGLKNPCELCPMEEALKYNRVERCELDGADRRSYELISAPYTNQDGTIDKVVEIVIDITDRKQAEKKIKESEEKYRYFIENSIEGVWVVDEDANTILINPSMTKMLGYTKDEMIGKSVFDFMDVESAELTRLHLEQRKKGISEERDAIMIHKGGNYINLRIRATPIFSKEGNYEGSYAFLTDVTNQKLAEQKLKESEEKYRILTEQSFLGLAILQDDWVIYVNKTLAHMFGYTLEEVMAWEKGGFINMIHPEYVKLVVEQANKKQLGELDVINQYQFKGIKKNRDILWLELYSKTIIYKGKPADFVSIHDITDKKISEKKLRESEIRYQYLFNNFPISISIFDLKGNLVESNRVIIKKLAEYINIDFVGQNFIDIIPHFQNANQLLRIFTERLNSIRKGRALEPIDLLVITKSGKKVWLHWQSSRIEINNEVFFQVLIQDITEQKEAEERLKESEEKFRNISEQSLIGIGIVQDNSVKYANKKFTDIFGYSMEEMLSWVPEEFMITVHPEDREFVFDQVKKKQTGSEEYLENYQFRGITKSGKIIWLENFTKTIMYEGKPADFVAFIDITERKHAQEELVKLNQLKSELLRRTSHELKTPLVSIKGFTELLLQIHRDKLDALVISTLNEIKQGCLRLESLIADILKTAELESGATQLNKIEEDLAFLLRVCVNEIKGFLKLRNHTINLEIHDTIITHFEKEQIHQVISNLLNNAIKYTPPSGIIEIKSEIRDEFIVISIKDNGIGFTKDEKARIFKQFGKIERYGQGLDIIAEGSGFGLFISKKIIELHGGNIWVESEGRNKGSTFYFSLPIIKG